MSTTLPADPRPLRRRWTDFWFRPTDPTGLGFMRLVTGFLILYTHAIGYSMDLQVFFGKQGWYGHKQIEDERKNFPWTAQPLTEWEERSDSIPLPEYSHRRKAYLDFLHTLANDDAARVAAADYVERVNRLYEPYPRGGLSLLILLKQHPTEASKILVALTEGRQLFAEMAVIDPNTGVRGYAFLAKGDPDRPNPVFPAPMLTMPEADRVALARDAREILRVLPADYPGREYYEIGYLVDLDTSARYVTARFLRSLDTETAARRVEIIDYLEHWNVDPRKTLRTGHAAFSPWFHVTDKTQMNVIHGCVLVIMFLFTIGFCTRVTSVLTWLAAVSYIHRTQQILFGMDTMMNILLIYLMVGNSGAALSVDRLIARYRAVRASLRRSGTVDEATRAFLAAPPPSATAGLAIRLFQVHFCFIYLAAGLAKLKGPGWWNGNAFWDVMVNPEFTLMRYTWFEDWIRTTALVKPLYHFLTATGVWFTWGLEVALPFLVWTRLRPVMLWMAVVLHASIGVLMGLNLFELMMLVMLLAFMPASVIRARLKGGTGLPKAAVLYDPADEKSSRTAAAVVAADIDTQVALEPRKGPTVVTTDGAQATGPAAVSALFGRLRLLRLIRWVLWVPGVGGLLARRLFPAAGGGGGTPPSGGGVVKTPAAAS